MSRKMWKVVDPCGNVVSRHFLEGGAMVRAKEFHELYGDKYRVVKVKRKKARA